MPNYIAQENATGDLYRLTAKDKEAAYRLFGEVILKMEAVEDTGNVDINLEEVTKTPKGEVIPLFK